MNPKNHKKDDNKINLIVMDSTKEVDIKSDMDENIVFTSMQKEVNLSSLHQNEEKEMKKLFHINTKIKNINVDAIFDSSSHGYIIVEYMVGKIGWEAHDHYNPYPLDG